MSMMVIAVAVAFIVVSERPTLVQRRHKRELVVFMVLLLLGTGLNIAYYTSIPLPNPLNGLYKLLEPLSHWAY